MKKAAYLTGWVLFGAAALLTQFYVGKWATQTEKDPQLAETVQFGPERYESVGAMITREGIERHIRALSEIPSRFTGTPGCDQAAEYIIDEFRALGFGDPVIEEFPVVAPVHSRAEIETDAAVYPMRPLYPNGICPAAFPEEGFRTRLIYAGFGRLQDVNGKDVEGATVVVETGGREHWLYLVDLGAEAVIFVENQRPPRAFELFTQTRSHQNIPRFWMTREEAAPLLERLHEGDLPATLHSDARWEQRIGKNILLDIPGVSDAPHNRTELVVLSAFYDSSSFAPALAPGAEQACGIATLLELAKVIRQHPFEKTVRLLATSGHHQAMAGIRHYVWEHVGRHDAPMRDVTPMDHAAFFGLDLSSSSERVGLFYAGRFFEQSPNNLKPRVSDLGRRASEYAAVYAQTMGRPAEAVFVDTINPTAGKDWQNYMPTPLALEHEAALLAGIPALSFVTTNDARLYSGTPNDTEVDLDKLLDQARLLACLLPNAFNVEGRYLRRSLPRSICRIRGRAVWFDPRESYLPDNPLEGGLVMGRRNGDFEPFFAGVSLRPVVATDADGGFELLGMGTTEELWPHKAMMAFEPFVVERGRITWAPDFGQLGMASYPITLTPVQKEMELMCVAFECRTLEIYNLFDPRNFNHLIHVEVFDAGSNSPPARFGTSLVAPGWPSFLAPTATVYAEPGAVLKITAGAGVTQKRMLLLNVPEELPEGMRLNTGVGFRVDDTSALRRTYLQGAQDMWRLNESRIAFFGENGIENERVTQLHEEAGRALDKAHQAFADRDYQAYFAHAARALSLETRAYPDVVGMANDVVRGLIFYLALLLPFAFTMERLFLPGRRIETRIAGIIAFFMAMFFILRATHPAFAIVLSPMVILLGFTVATLSSVVISIVMSKLEALVSKQKIEQEGEHSSGVQAVSGFALALDLGIANMRRRKARTILTSITLVALTFSVLSFVSVSAQIRLQRYVYRDGATPYEGVLLRTRNWAPFPFEYYAALRNELGDTCILAPRYWYYGALVLNQSNIEIRMGDVIRTLRALVGFSAQEKELMDVEGALLGASRWLSPEVVGEEPVEEILFPVDVAADFLGMTAADPGRRLSDPEKLRVADAILGKQVSFLGRPFTVVGVFDWEKMNELVDIDGEGLTPFDPVQMEKKAQEEGAPDPDEIQRYIHHSFREVAITSERVLANLGGDLRSVAILPHDPETMQDPERAVDLVELVEGLVNRMDYILFANLGGVPTVLSSRDATRISELWNLVILMAIAGLIVFNTMLGAVYERTKEIATYTALGIAPSHIGRLFMVEAGVFSIVGVMAGYVLGQSVARLVAALDIEALAMLNLNYSSLAGVGACVLVMAMVLLSSAYPARKASQLGVPDIERRWKLPPTKESRVTINLPFTVSPREAQGLVAFLKEYLDSHIDVSVGSFYVENVEAGPAVTDSGTGVTAQFWLTPFDLGVSQYTTFYLELLPNMDVCGVRVEIERLSGDAGSWRRANSGFMMDMRSQFLIWRNLTPAVRAGYVERGRDYALA